MKMNKEKKYSSNNSVSCGESQGIGYLISEAAGSYMIYRPHNKSCRNVGRAAQRGYLVTQMSRSITNRESSVDFSFNVVLLCTNSSLESNRLEIEKQVRDV